MATAVPINFDDVVGSITDVAKSLGVFKSVQGGEPTSSPPGGGLTCSVWFLRLAPDLRSSGLNVTSVICVLTARIMGPDTYQPRDGEDPRMLRAASALFAALSGDIDLSGPTGSSRIDEVDLLGRGAGGTPLSMQGGYVSMAGEGGEVYRIIDVTVPLILNDVYAQAR